MTTQDLRTLANILEKLGNNQKQDGAYGIKSCKEHILWTRQFLGKSLWSQLEEMIERCKSDPFFNLRLILACYELINEDK